MAGRRGIHHHELLAGLADDPGKRLKDGNFLGAGRTQIFLEEGTPLGVERCSPCFRRRALSASARLGGATEAGRANAERLLYGGKLGLAIGRYRP